MSVCECNITGRPSWAENILPELIFRDHWDIIVTVIYVNVILQVGQAGVVQNFIKDILSVDHWDIIITVIYVNVILQVGQAVYKTCFDGNQLFVYIVTS